MPRLDEQRDVARNILAVALLVRVEVAVKYASGRQGARVSGQDGGTGAQGARTGSRILGVI